MNSPPTLSEKLCRALEKYPPAAENCYDTLRFMHVLEQMALMKWRNVTAATVGHYLLTAGDAPVTPDYLINRILPYVTLINDPLIRNLVTELAVFEASIDWYSKFVAGLGLKGRNVFRKLEPRGKLLGALEDEISRTCYREIEALL